MRVELAERGGKLLLACITATDAVDIESLAGNAAAAAEFGAEGCRQLEELGDRGYLSTATAMHAQTLYVLDRLDEADAWAGRAAELGASDDAETQMMSRQVRAKVLARGGEHDEAERLAREAVAIAAKTDQLNSQGEANADLGRGAPAQRKARRGKSRACQQALERYERKESVVMARRMRDRLAAVGA